MDNLIDCFQIFKLSINIFKIWMRNKFLKAFILREPLLKSLKGYLLLIVFYHEVKFLLFWKRNKLSIKI